MAVMQHAGDPQAAERLVHKRLEGAIDNALNELANTALDDVEAEEDAAAAE
jgi:hypothetical protein